MKLKPGDRVIVWNTMLYNGRTGVLESAPGTASDGMAWDWLVRLDAPGLGKERVLVIGVDSFQVMPL